MAGGTLAKKRIGNIGGRTDRYEYTRRNNIAKAEMNLDKIFISKFKNIKISEICDKYGINKSRAASLTLNGRDIHKIKVELDRMIREMYNIENYRKYDLSKSYSYHKWGKVNNEQVERGDRILLKESYYDKLTEK